MQSDRRRKASCAWEYKEGRKGPRRLTTSAIAGGLRHLVEWQRIVQDPGEFMSNLK